MHECKYPNTKCTCYLCSCEKPVSVAPTSTWLPCNSNNLLHVVRQWGFSPETFVRRWRLHCVIGFSIISICTLLLHTAHCSIAPYIDLGTNCDHHNVLFISDWIGTHSSTNMQTIERHFRPRAAHIWDWFGFRLCTFGQCNKSHPMTDQLREIIAKQLASSCNRKKMRTIIGKDARMMIEFIVW